MKVCTIVVGKWYERFAEATVPLMEHCIGVPVEVLKPEGDPFIAKMSLPLDEPMLFVDCDVVFRRKVDVRPWLDLAARGVFVSPKAWYAAKAHKQRMPGVNPDTFSMLGMFAAGPAHAAVYPIARELYRGEMKGAAWYDEQPVNVALDRFGIVREFLPDTTHRFMTNAARKDPSDISRHYPSWNQPLQRLLRIKAAAIEAWSHLGEPVPRGLLTGAVGSGNRRLATAAPIRPPNL